MGRDRELERCRVAAARAATGHACVLLVSGGPGIGKTRLATELATMLEAEFAVRWGRCWEAPGAPAFWPWVQVVRSCLASDDRDELLGRLGRKAADLLGIAPELEALLGRAEPSSPSDPEEARFRLFDAVAGLLRAAAAARPLLVILDDLHRGDAGSLLLLRFLATDLATSPIAIVCGFRDLEIDPRHPLARTIGEIERHVGVERVELAGLTREEVSRLLEDGIEAPVSPALVRAVCERSLGNPLFVRSIARVLDGPVGDPIAEVRRSPALLPATIRDAITVQLSRRSALSRRILEVAAVVGRDFETAEIVRLGIADPDEVLAALDEAEAAQLVTLAPSGIGQYRFTHVLVREVLYEGMPRRMRTALHGRISRVLEELHRADLDPHLDRLALHFFEAAHDADPEEAIRYLNRAATHATSILAYEKAVDHRALALGLLEQTGAAPARVAEALLELGGAQRRTGEGAEARASFARAAALARRHGMPEVLARAALGYGEPWSITATDGTLVDLLSEALTALGPGDHTLRARLLGGLAWASYHSGLARRESLTSEAIAVAERVGDHEALVFVLTAQSVSLRTSRNVHERFEAASRLLGAASEAGDREAVARTHLELVCGLLEVGRVAEAWRHLESGARLAEEIRAPRVTWQAMVQTAMRAQVEGRHEQAERLANDALILGRRSHPDLAELNYRGLMFVLLRERGRSAELVRPCEEMAASFPEFPIWRAALATVLLDVGDLDAARAIIKRMAPDLSDLADDFSRLPALCLMASASAATDSVRKQHLLAALEPHREQSVVVGAGALWYGSVARYIGVLQASLERWEDAEVSFECALAANERAGSPPQVVQTRIDHACALLARGRESDRRRALAELDRARSGARALALPGLLARIEAVEHGSVASAAGPGGSAERLLPGEAGAAPVNAMRREGEVWTIRFAGRSAAVRHLKGMHYIALLLRIPGVEMRATSLVLLAPPQAKGAGDTRELERAIGGATLGAYRQRLEDLVAEVALADLEGERTRWETAREEIARLGDELGASSGAKPGAGVATSIAERARISVRNDVARALRTLSRQHPSFHEHLVASLKTGASCTYRPGAGGARWDVSGT